MTLIGALESECRGTVRNLYWSLASDGRWHMSTQEKHSVGQGSNLRDPVRVIALSDGVFAIILTILVLDLKVPELKPCQSLCSVLVGLGPVFVAYVISFFMNGWRMECLSIN